MCVCGQCDGRRRALNCSRDARKQHDSKAEETWTGGSRPIILTTDSVVTNPAGLIANTSGSNGDMRHQRAGVERVSTGEVIQVKTRIAPSLPNSTFLFSFLQPNRNTISARSKRAVHNTQASFLPRCLLFTHHSNLVST